ncbi:Leptomycin B resistance protein pmd1 [Neolecta irregularis DAH-3]|uniref:Leptomycin B resistance protein pmd1 n=1 Tax=Neolecta irregularis (strain DAH-3) TaxID=1198029 RepID=A0A1U7LJ17_NEOID|nr:Leptomycin B resistance protein pmd1 [Neolecta irregularis DAH-3]|eukprot:OLL22650.1 Leptomycin B resistance protein pmd1 [Neolecta irregularis DAH-3]
MDRSSPSGPSFSNRYMLPGYNGNFCINNDVSSTSALDSTSEVVVNQALEKASQGRTTVAIAHRLSTIQRADVIYFFEAGKVLEQGTHNELIALRGKYFEMVQMQQLDKTA